MQVVEVMVKDVKTARGTDSVKNAAQTMKKNDVGALIVVGGSGEAIGIVTERDIVIDIVADGTDPETVKVEDIMTGELITIGPEADLEEAADIMTEKDIKRLPVIYEGKLVGIVSASDLITYEKKLIEKLSKLFALSPARKIGG
jgi:CBS domain-containing protein